MKTTLLSFLSLAIIGTRSFSLDDKTVTVIDESHATDAHLAVEAPPAAKMPDSVSIGVNTQDLAHFTKFAQYAGASYCDPVAGKPVYCKGDICPAGKHSNATVYSVFQGTMSDILGFIAVDTAAEEIVISVRGSSSIHNWVADVVWARQSTDLCDDCWVHLGFHFAYNEIIDTVNASLASATRLHPSYKITLAGHSLGGAVGTLLALRLRDLGYDLELYTYGAPRVGNEALARHLSLQQQHESTNSGEGGGGRGANYRVTHWSDVVARLPPLNRDFRHSSPEFWLPRGPSARTRYAAGEIAACAGYANGQCNAGAPWWVVDVASHLFYFVAISKCGEGEDGVSRLRFDAASEPVNGTTATTGGEGGLDQATADTLAMYAKLDQEYAGAMESSLEGEVVF